ncbi:MAG: D-aminoacyl-tRNA deacylase [Candidatus Krumholzibacteria bacterium]|jgi:D-tyrosyl-tRNA(Tyr) deacylase|nr:D-aminoacyl-tRNA deacylase [Candidatus Krumholzibacteria bacterium]MDP6668799.1 D-aminoacyl-tRNA deacylase [Candidatus Krumholzibacteria bacterium]MDP6797919.1 D-aminoacyl-tRNA deacylase [Candidatus Krumholzibacteria bacterium]MDP7021751.1 D-aminoacyl-tRNA deacylase [Candidatus Krumholzibacteria bacterium]
MRVVLQRVSSARVRVEGEIVGEIGSGLLLLCAFRQNDGEKELRWMAEKCQDLRIFPDSDGKMNLSLRDTGAAILAVSQFTLYGNCSKGRRPSFVGAADADQASGLYDDFLGILRESDLLVEGGVFQAHMKVELENDGPVTLLLEKEAE